MSPGPSCKGRPIHASALNAQIVGLHNTPARACGARAARPPSAATRLVDRSSPETPAHCSERFSANAPRARRKLFQQETKQPRPNSAHGPLISTAAICWRHGAFGRRPPRTPCPRASLRRPLDERQGWRLVCQLARKPQPSAFLRPFSRHQVPCQAACVQSAAPSSVGALRSPAAGSQRQPASNCGSPARHAHHPSPSLSHSDRSGMPDDGSRS